MINIHVDWRKKKHNRIRNLKYGMPLNMFVPSTITDSTYKAEPLVWGMLNGASDDDKQAYKEFDDTGILPKRFSKMIVWLREIMS